MLLVYLLLLQMLTFNLKTTFFTVKTSNAVIVAVYILSTTFKTSIYIYNKKNITRQLKDMDFMFEWQACIISSIYYRPLFYTNYLTPCMRVHYRTSCFYFFALYLESKKARKKCIFNFFHMHFYLQVRDSSSS